MICPHCGADTLAVKERCTACGQSVALARPPAASSRPPQLPVPPEPSSPDADATRLPDAASVAGPANAPAISTEGPTRLHPSASHVGGEEDTSWLPGIRGSGRSETGPLTPGQAFGPRYHIIRLLGIGGMGAVYQAWDAELSVAVALKVVRPEATADPAAASEVERRFKQELLLARQVTHKNVVRIHDLGEINGIKYITMTYVEGTDLAKLLTKGKLPLPQALGIAKQVAYGLRAAHQVGIVHRDLKPANIMIAGDDALIMDFGIARSTSRAGTGAPQSVVTVPGDARVFFTGPTPMPAATMAGMVMGTLDFMAPEQFKLQPVDHRADIYAFGLILYDMLLGSRRYSGTNSAVARLQARLKQPPPSARSIDPEIPEALDRIVTRCLEPDPQRRFATTAELVTEFHRLDNQGKPLPVRRVVALPVVAAGIALSVMLLAGTWWYASRPAAPVRAALPVLIANFDNRAKDPLFEGTLEQALGIGIEGASFITVYPRRDALRSAAQIKAGSTLDESVARLVANREGIKVVLSGSIEARGARYAVTVKAQQPDGTIISSATATASSKDDVLRVVGVLASRMRRSLGDTAPPKPGEMDPFTTASLEAAHAYALGQEKLATNKLAEAIDYYRQAVDLDPNLARAYAGLAVAHANLKKQAEAGEYYKKALALVDRMSEREKGRTLGAYYLSFSGNYEQAIDTLRTHVGRYPADAAAHTNLAVAYVRVGNMAESAAASRRATEITPRNLLRRYNYALHSMYAGNLTVAVAEAERVLEQDPGYELAYLTLALCALFQGDLSKAAENYGKLEKVNSVGASLSRMGLADLNMYAGRYRDSLGILLTGIAADEKEGNSGELAYKLVALAEAHNALGRKTAAAAAANKAVQASTIEGIHFLAARALIDAGEDAKAEQLATALEGKLQKQTKSLALMIRGGIAMKRNRLADAVDAYRDAQKAHDSWISRLLLGKAYVEAGHFPEALTQLDTAEKRASEATDLFDSDTTTLRYLPPLYYWLGRAQEGIGSADAARKSYQRFIAIREHADPRDALLADARRRAIQ